MPITFACSCGKQLKTADENAGKRVKCPACGGAVAVPGGSAAAPPAKAPAAPAPAKATGPVVVRFQCDCGKQLQAKPELAGRKVKCPACSAELTVPGADNGIQPAKPAAKKPDLTAATTKAPKPKGAPPPPDVEDEDELPTRPRRKFEEESEEELPRKARRKGEIEDEDEHEAEPPRKEKRKAKKSSAPLIIVGAVAALLLLAGGGFAIWYFFIRDDVSKPIVKGTQPQKLPDGGEQALDLELVPRNAAGFGSVRVAKLLENPTLKVGLPAAKQLLEQRTGGGIDELEQLAGFTLNDIERATVIVLEPNQESFAIVVTIRKPYEKSKLLGLLARGAKERQHQGKTLHDATETALHFATDKMFVVGPPKGLEMLFDKLAKPDAGAQVALTDAVTVAKGDHHLVAAGTLTPELVKQAKEGLPPEFQPFESLLDASSITVTANITDHLELDVHLKFADESKSKKGKETADEARGFAKVIVAAQKKEAAKDPVNGKEMIQALEGVERLIQQTTIKQEGTTVQLSLKTDSLLQLAPLMGLFKGQGGGNPLPVGVSPIAVNNLRQLVLAMHSFNDAENRLPVGIRDKKEGKPLLSWRVELLPYLGAEEKKLYEQFKRDEPWDGPNNIQLVSRMPAIFAHPDRPTREPGMTYFQVFATAPGTPYDLRTGPPFPDSQMSMPATLLIAPRLPASFSDGTSTSVLIVEAGAAVPWTKPADVYYQSGRPVPALGDKSRGFLAAMADGVVVMVPPTISDKTLRNAITPGDGAVMGPDWPRK